MFQHIQIGLIIFSVLGLYFVLGLQITFEPIFRWYDFYMGIYYDREDKIFYVFPLPMIGFKIQFQVNNKGK